MYYKDKKFNILISLILIVSLMLISSLVVIAQSETDKGIPDYVTITTGPLTGSWFPIAGYISDKLMEKFPLLSSTVIEGAALGNLKIVDDGRDAQIGIATYAPFLYMAQEGKLEGVSGENTSAVCAFLSSHFMMLVREDSDIHSVTDLAGKRIVPITRSSGPELMFRDVLDYHDMSYDAIKDAGGKVIFAGYTEMASLMKDGHVDMVLTGGHAPQAVGIEIEASLPIRILEIKEDILNGMLEAYPYLGSSVLPAGVYKGQKKPVRVLDMVGTIIVNNDLSEEFVYQLTKLLMDESEYIREQWPYCDLLEPTEVGLTGIARDKLHPGAERYWKEIGVLK